MKNILRGGLRSLIPNHGVQDADEVVDEMDEDELDQAEERPDEEPDEEEEEEEEEEETPAQEEASPRKQINVVSVDEDNEEKPDKAKVSSRTKTNPPMPSPPKVTLLSLDSDEIVTDDRPVPAKTATKPKPISAKAPTKPVRQVATKKSAGVIWDKHEDNVRHIPVADITINPNQPRRRFNAAEMDDLKSSIAQHGILQPLVVRRINDGFELVAGERRLRAAKLLNWGKVPCVVRRNVSSGASRLELALIENIQREDLNPVEEALAYKQLNEEYGMTHEEIGQRVGRSRVGITNIIRVLQLPEEIQKGLIDGKISSGHAKAILMIPDDEKQLRFYRHLVEEGLTVRKAETRARRIQRTMSLDDPLRSRRRGRSAYEVKYSGLLEDRYGYYVRLKFDEHKNRYDLMFRCYSKGEIDELVGRLMGTEELPDPDQDQKD